ncbi:MAG TPA: hypothetical protein VGL81_09850 [Polyangiaceae bacterium]
MRGAGAWSAMGAVALLGACATETPPTPHVAAHLASPPESDAAALPEAAPQYVVGDPTRPNMLTVLPVGEDAMGVVLEGVRFVLHGATVHTSRDVADAPLQSAWRIPARMGGGFLFRSRATLYATESFEGLLRPVVALPADVADVSFGPKAALVRSESGERWMLDPASGRRVPIAPAGLLEVAALDDGRAMALVEGGQLLVSTDGGDHWTDATASLRAPPRRVFVSRATATQKEALWVETQGSTPFGLLPGGRLAAYDALPAAEPPPALRAKPSAWREEEPPLRRAMRSGAPSRDGSALVVASGDLVQVDVVSGAVDVVAAGKLPPDATCVATRTQDDVVFTCARSSGGSFVVAHALDRAPTVEQTFADAGRFVVSDDGGILWVGFCDKPMTGQHRVACVRSPGGGWQQYDLDAAGDAGTGPTYNIVRWIPRADGGAIAVVGDIGGTANAWGLLDGRTGEVHAWPTDALSPQVRSALQNSEGARGSPVDPARLADRSWTVTPQGTLRGWAMLGNALGAVEVGVDGSLQTSPFTFERIASAGAIALARTREGRIWQTLDRGATWSEVAAPPAARPGGWVDPHACSLVGCDLGQWYRVGWAPTQPAPQAPTTTAPPAPRIEQSPAPKMACHATGDVKRSASPRDDRSPDDLGLGVSRLAVSDAKGLTDFIRLVFPRRIVGAVRETDPMDEPASRAVVHGPATQPGDERLIVSAFNHDPMALARQVAFVPAFDPAGPVRRASVTMRDLVVAGRAAGLSQAELLREDPVPSATVPVTPVDPAAPDDLLVQLVDGAAALERASPSATARPRVAYEAGRGDEWRFLGAVGLEGSGVAWLEEDSSGRARVMRLGAAATPTAAFELDAPPTADLYPANVDALALGPRGELAVVRTPSGSEPPSAADPAVLLVPGAPAVALAPWSTLTPADDPACKADPAGWRVTVQTIAPWLRLDASGDLRGMEDSFMLARVRWSPARACLEAVEVRTEDMPVASPGGGPPVQTSQWGSAWDAPVESWVVARFAGGASAGRVVVIAGGELRQSLECKLGAP